MKAKNFTLLKRLLLLFVLVGLSSVAFGQRTISGTVTDENGAPLPFANVYVEGTTIGVTTDIDGNYKIKVPEGGTALAVSFTGYGDQTLSLSNSDRMDFAMKEGTLLDEVVVVGYGSVQKRDVTGAVTSVSSKDFNQGIITSPEQLLQGRAAGVQITSASGEPGGAINIRIRGTSSIRSGNNPLFVIDGVPLAGNEINGGVQAGGANSGFGSSAPKNPLNFINPNDIESIDILKDASATAIYGSRGANGVVLITTKKGAQGKGTLEYGYSLGISNISKKYDLLTASEYMDAWAAFNPAANREDQDFGADTDWQDVIFRTGLTHNSNLAFGGSSGNSNYRASFGYQDQRGIVENSGVKRITGRFSGSKSFINDRLKISTQVTVADIKDDNVPITQNSGFEGDLMAAALKFNPTIPEYLEDLDKVELAGYVNDMGELFGIDTSSNVVQVSLTEPNPRAILDNTKGFTNTIRGLASLTGELAITNDLSFTSRVGYDRSLSSRKDAFSGNLLANGMWNDINKPEEKKGRLFLNETQAQNVVWESYFNYNKNISENLTLGAMLGYSYQEFRNGGNNIEMTDFLRHDLQTMLNNYSIAGKVVPTNSFSSIDELQAIFGRLNLNVGEKYLLTANLRRDGSTRFGSDFRYGYFPSFALKWRVAEEGFVGDFLDDLSLRIGYGLTGNQEFDHNIYTDRERFNDVDIDNSGNINGVGSIQQVAFENESIKWEATSQFNAGIDFAFGNYRFNGSLDFYRKNTNDLQVKLPSAQPAPNPFVWDNLDADIINQGFELSLNTLAVDNSDFQWNIQTNVAFNDNEVKNLGGLVINTGQIDGQGLTGAFAQRIAEGQPLYAFFLREFVGYGEGGSVQLYEGGDIQKFVGASPLPKWNIGLNNTISYKGLSLNFAFLGQFGQYVYSNTGNAFFTAGSIGGGRNVTQETLDQSIIVDPNGEDRTNAPDVSTRFLEKADYLRLQNATLSYNIRPNTDVISNVQLFVTGQNLLLFTGYSGQDPEVSTNKQIQGVPSLGIDYTSYPKARTFIIGANVSF